MLLNGPRRGQQKSAILPFEQELGCFTEIASGDTNNSKYCGYQEYPEIVYKSKNDPAEHHEQ